MLCDPPVIVAPDEYPGHAIWTDLVAIGEIDVACGDCNIGSDLPDPWHRVGFHTHASGALAEICADGSAAILQFIDGTEQHGVFHVECHVPVEVMAVERFHPCSVQTFDGWCCHHGTLLLKRRLAQIANWVNLCNFLALDASYPAKEKSMPQIRPEGAFHRLTIPPLATSLENLRKILTTVEAHAATLAIDPDMLLNSRLAPDMFNLIQQLQYALFIPVEFARHFTGEAPPQVGYEEKTFAEVRASLELALNYLRSIPPEAMDARAGLVVPILFDGKQGLAAEHYAARIIMPDFYFHLTIAYAILRHTGVPLGKSDFIGKLETVPIG
jgi:uncharacterized protein